jgi:coenzyme F420-0:L-glutamate ligase/coenzyme F420-1:gamma-L-glutamate ligase
MPLNQLKITGLSGLPEIAPGDDLPHLIAQAIGRDNLRVHQGNILVIAQKIVSKAEGRVVILEEVDPSSLALSWAGTYDKDPRVIEVVLRESRRLVRMERGLLIAETRQGYICANAGVDTSNVPKGSVTLLPEDPDQSAAEIRKELETELGFNLAVIISDTFGRPWRDGLANVALGVSGMRPFMDYQDKKDRFGNTLKATQMAVADELASAAELAMGKTGDIPVALIQGFTFPEGEGNGREIIRPSESDLFR